MANESSSAAAQRRRVTKPLMERRRRARINRCLAQLQAILGANFANKTQTGCYPRQTRLEKADILEMTVHYIREAHRRQSTSTKLIMDTDDHSNNANADSTTSTDYKDSPEILRGEEGFYSGSDKFQEGYRLCMLEVAQYVRSLDVVAGQAKKDNRTAVESGGSGSFDPDEDELSARASSEFFASINKEGDMDASAKNRSDVPFKKRRRDGDYLSSRLGGGGGLGRSSEDKTSDLLEHLRNRYESIDGEVKTKSPPTTPPPGQTSGEESQLNKTLVQSVRDSSQHKRTDYRCQGEPEVRQTAFCWRPW